MAARRALSGIDALTRPQASSVSLLPAGPILAHPLGHLQPFLLAHKLSAALAPRILLQGTDDPLDQAQLLPEIVNDLLNFAVFQSLRIPPFMTAA
jgi:hypothetical protein